jgi:hypothetical protein
MPPANNSLACQNSEREGVQETRQFIIGDKALIRNPKRFQDTRGTITKIGQTPVYITSESGNKLQREPKNLILENEQYQGRYTSSRHQPTTSARKRNIRKRKW